MSFQYIRCNNYITITSLLHHILGILSNPYIITTFV